LLLLLPPKGFVAVAVAVALGFVLENGGRCERRNRCHAVDLTFPAAVISRWGIVCHPFSLGKLQTHEGAPKVQTV
jgi:hypothetical protein